MRVVGGKYKGRRFGPKMDKWPTRPTTDSTKESVFNIIDNLYYFEGKKVLDLFGGTGSVTLEFISRGVDSVTIIENHSPCIKYIKSLMEAFQCSDQVNILAMDAMKFIDNNVQQFDLIFIDPPYNLIRLAEIPDIILNNNILKSNGMMILEHSNLHDFKNHPKCTKVKKYGQTIASFFELEDEEE